MKMKKRCCGKSVSAVCILVILTLRVGSLVQAQLPCDFDDDGTCDTADVLALVDQGDLVSGVVPTDLKFDLTGDGLANIGDLHQWFREAEDYNPADHHLGGDANLDGSVDRIDLNLLALNWQGTGKVWSEGDFWADGEVNAADLMTIGINWQTSTRNAAAVNVPEPTGWMLVILAAMLTWYAVERKST